MASWYTCACSLGIWYRVVSRDGCSTSRPSEAFKANSTHPTYQSNMPRPSWVLSGFSREEYKLYLCLRRCSRLDGLTEGRTTTHSF